MRWSSPNIIPPKTLVALSLLLLPLFLAGCATNPVTGKKELNFLSLEDEERMGAESDLGIVAQYGVVDDTKLTAYVQGIGNQLVPVSHMPEEDFEFRVLDDPVVNAFALPGGYVYVTRGIMAYLNDEAALAGIMGHEVGHVTARHSAQRYTQQLLLGMGAGTLGQLFKNIPLAADILGGSASLMLLKYSRDDERQADQLGVEYATKVGYNTRPMAEFFHTLDQLSGDHQLPGWASTHPDPGDRYNTVLHLTNEWQARVGRSDFRTDRNGYIERLENLVFGPNPRHGFLHEKEFVHPDMAFRFPVPKNWKLHNTAAAVQMAEPNGMAVILFELVPDRNDPTAAATAFVEDNSLTEQARRSQRISGYPAVEVIATATSQDGILAILSTFIGKDGRVYVFHGFTDQSNFANYRPHFTKVAGGFAPLRDQQLLTVQPVVVHVVMTERGATFREQVRNYPIPDDAGIDLNGLALLNGFEPDERVPQGTILKVLQRRVP